VGRAEDTAAGTQKWHHQLASHPHTAKRRDARRCPSLGTLSPRMGVGRRNMCSGQSEQLDCPKTGADSQSGARKEQNIPTRRFRDRVLAPGTMAGCSCMASALRCCGVLAIPCCLMAASAGALPCRDYRPVAVGLYWLVGVSLPPVPDSCYKHRRISHIPRPFLLVAEWRRVLPLLVMGPQPDSRWPSELAFQVAPCAEGATVGGQRLPFRVLATLQH
jgi:hypothetical protein